MCLKEKCDLSIQYSNLEADKILRHSLYLTFNSPEVDEYHRGIFLSYHPLLSFPNHGFSGTLFHASYCAPHPPLLPTWVLEEREVKNILTSQSLVLLYRLGTLDSGSMPIEEQFETIREVLRKVPLGRSERERVLGKLREGEGNARLNDYDCVIWMRDALEVLVKEGLVDLDRKSVDQVMTESRALAGPQDAKAMVGVDFGGFKVFN